MEAHFRARPSRNVRAESAAGCRGTPGAKAWAVRPRKRAKWQEGSKLERRALCTSLDAALGRRFSGSAHANDFEDPALFPFLLTARITRDALAARVEILRGRGVTFPAVYPQLNLDQDPVSLRSTESVVDTVELLVANIVPRDIEVEPKMPSGDVDILIQAPVKIKLQLKSLDPFSMDKGGYYPHLGRIVAYTSLQVKKANPGYPVVSSFTRVKVFDAGGDNVRVEGEQWNVPDHAWPAHLVIVELEDALVWRNANDKVVSAVQGAVRQLMDALEPDDAVIAPVISLTRFPHHQLHLIRFIRDELRSRERWSRIGGVVLVANEFSLTSTNDGPRPLKRRLIPIVNKKAKETERLPWKLINPNALDEELAEIRTTFIDLEYLRPESKPHSFEIRDGAFYINGVRFGPMPKGALEFKGEVHVGAFEEE